MSRSIPIQLEGHLREDATTTCLLLKITPESSAPTYGVTNLNRPVSYDDGNGEIYYSSYIGLVSSDIRMRSDMSVDNAEETSLLPEFDVPISEEDIRAGLYDFAKFSLYLVNYNDLSQGHITIQEGTIGRVTVDASGLSFVNEIRGLVATLKQSVCEKDSLTCRATYGSQPEGSPLPGPVERFPCGKDATQELLERTVLSVGIENTVTFSVSGPPLANGELNPGIVLWVTGMNSGRTYEVDNNTASEITLAHETSFPIQVGDLALVRPDCNKHARDDEKGCIAEHHWGQEWVLHFRGEPDIPIGDAEQMEIPGASSTPGQGGFPSIPIDSDIE